MSSSSPSAPPPAYKIPAETPLQTAAKLLSNALGQIHAASQAEKGPATGGTAAAAVPASAVSSLELAYKVLSRLDPYLDDKSAPASAALQDLIQLTMTHDWRKAHADGHTTGLLAPTFSAGPYEGNLVGNIARSLRARRVLEIGMFTATTTCAIAERLPADAKVVSLELDAYLKQLVTPVLEKHGLGSPRVDIRAGPAQASLEAMVKAGEEPFDLVFIDADKTGYAGYLRTLLDRKLVRSGSVILVDNTLFKGGPLLSVQEAPSLQDPSHGLNVHAESVEAVRAFNDAIAHDARVEVSLMSVRDGLSWVYVK